MTTLLFSNQAQTTLARPVNLTDTTIYLAAGTGSYFPVPVLGEGFKLTLINASNRLITEILLVTSVNGDEFTVTRAQEGTTAKQWVVGDFAANLMTAGTLQDFVQIQEMQDGSISPIFNDVTMNSGKVLATPVDPLDIANKDYVDGLVGGGYTAGTGLSLSPLREFSITSTGVAPGVYGNAATTPIITVNSQGQITNVTTALTTISIGNVTGKGTMALQNSNAITVTGGSINATVIGDVTPAEITATRYFNISGGVY